jgi:hypothetical protein
MLKSSNNKLTDETSKPVSVCQKDLFLFSLALPHMFFIDEEEFGSSNHHPSGLNLLPFWSVYSNHGSVVRWHHIKIILDPQQPYEN